MDSEGIGATNLDLISVNEVEKHNFSPNRPIEARSYGRCRGTIEANPLEEGEATGNVQHANFTHAAIPQGSVYAYDLDRNTNWRKDAAGYAAGTQAVGEAKR